MHHKLHAVYVRGQQGEVVAYLEELPGMHAQGATVDEARKNLEDAVDLLFASNRELTRETFASAVVLHREEF